VGNINSLLVAILHYYILIAAVNACVGGYSAIKENYNGAYNVFVSLCFTSVLWRKYQLQHVLNQKELPNAAHHFIFGVYVICQCLFT